MSDKKFRLKVGDDVIILKSFWRFKRPNMRGKIIDRYRSFSGNFYIVRSYEDPDIVFEGVPEKFLIKLNIKDVNKLKGVL